MKFLSLSIVMDRSGSSTIHEIGEQILIPVDAECFYNLAQGAPLLFSSVRDGTQALVLVS